MKHLLNNLSEEEKNRIREQHEGGMNIAIDNFKKLVETKLGDVKPYLNEASKETCEQCGGEMREGECVEQCGSMKEEEMNEQSSGVKFDDYAVKKLEGCGFEKVDDGKYIFKDPENGNRVTYTVVAEKFANSNYIGHSLYDQDGNKYYSLPSDACWVEFDKLIGCK